MGFRYKGGAQAEAREREFFARQIGRTSCGFCSWQFVGTFGEGHGQAIAHREREHPPPPSRAVSRRRDGSAGARREREERALELRLAGGTWPTIAEEFGMSRNGAQLAAKRALARRENA